MAQRTLESLPFGAIEIIHTQVSSSQRELAKDVVYDIVEVDQSAVRSNLEEAYQRLRSTAHKARFNPAIDDRTRRNLVKGAFDIRKELKRA